MCLVPRQYDIGKGQYTYRVACRAGSCGLADEMRDDSHTEYVTHKIAKTHNTLRNTTICICQKYLNYI